MRFLTQRGGNHGLSDTINPCPARQAKDHLIITTRYLQQRSNIEQTEHRRPVFAPQLCTCLSRACLGKTDIVLVAVEWHHRKLNDEGVSCLVLLSLRTLLSPASITLPGMPVTKPTVGTGLPSSPTTTAAAPELCSPATAVAAAAADRPYRAPTDGERSTPT
jgi:hypothetical protein